MNNKATKTATIRLVLGLGLGALTLAACGSEDATGSADAVEEVTSDSVDAADTAVGDEEEAMEDEDEEAMEDEEETAVDATTAGPDALFTDLALGPIENRDQLSALDGSGWFIENTSTPLPQSGTLSFTWDQDRGLVGLFSDECSVGEFLLNNSTAAGWEVVRTNSDFEVGCDRLLGQVFDTGSVVQISRTEAGLSFDAGDIGSFDAMHVQSTSVQDGPTAEVGANDGSLSE